MTYLVTFANPETLIIQTVKYKTIKQAEADAKKYKLVIQAVAKGK